ncbi:MAG: hypothetical protein KF742_01760 [Cryobacterium sp.]|nr:hypothetical protein [Cryobacterium sp.]
MASRVLALLAVFALGAYAQVPDLLAPESNSVRYGFVTIEIDASSGPAAPEFTVVHIQSASGSFNRTIELGEAPADVYSYTFDVTSVNSTEGVTSTTPDNKFVPTNGSLVHIYAVVKYPDVGTNFTTAVAENITIISECSSPRHTLESNCTQCVAGANSTAAANCSVCNANRFGELCELTVSACRTSRCSAAGNCTGELEGCVCDANRFGASCSQTATACAATRCSERGSCTGQLEGCLCNATLNYGGENCSACAGNYALDEEDLSCGACTAGWFGAGCMLNQSQCRAATCSSRGSCIGGSVSACLCDVPYTGANCSAHRCGAGATASGVGSEARCVCPAGRVYRPNTTLSTLCVPSCSGHGTYNETSLLCECNHMYFGPACETSENPEDEDMGTETMEFTEMRVWLPTLVIAPAVWLLSALQCWMAHRS